MKTTLDCFCDGCSDWQIIGTETSGFDETTPAILLCLTCGVEYLVQINVPSEYRLQWVGVESEVD